jgi:hypothetical protein
VSLSGLTREFVIEYCLCDVHPKSGKYNFETKHCQEIGFIAKEAEWPCALNGRLGALTFDRRAYSSFTPFPSFRVGPTSVDRLNVVMAIGHLDLRVE